MWKWLKENHPIIYEVVWSGVFLMAAASLAHEFLKKKKGLSIN